MMASSFQIRFSESGRDCIGFCEFEKLAGFPRFCERHSPQSYSMRLFGSPMNPCIKSRSPLLFLLFGLSLFLEIPLPSLQKSTMILCSLAFLITFSSFGIIVCCSPFSSSIHHHCALSHSRAMVDNDLKPGRANKKNWVNRNPDKTYLRPARLGLKQIKTKTERASSFFL